MNKAVSCVLTGCLLLSSCSSRPRNFEPTLATPAGDRAAFEDVFARCHDAIIAGKLNSSGKAASIGAGAKTGAGTAAVGGTAAALAGGWGGVALASATVVLLPFAVIGGAVGMSHAKRAKKERAMKAAMEGCLRDKGFEVAGWSRAIRHPAIVQPGPAVR